MQLNQKGQAFSVFKLLIAAIVAVVILGILLNILNIIPGLGQNNPNAEAATLIKNISNNTTNVQTSRDVQFNSQNNNLNARAIAQAADFVVQTDQICIFSGQFYTDDEESKIFTETGGTSITYTGTASSVNAAIKGMCDRGSFYTDVEFDTFITDPDMEAYGPEGEFSESCGCIAEDNPGKCCVLLLVRR